MCWKYNNIGTYFLYIFFYSKRFYLFLSVISDSRWKLYDRGNCYKSRADTAGLMTPGTADQRTGNENEARRILWRGWKIEQLQMHLQLVKKKNNDAFFWDTRHSSWNLIGKSLVLKLLGKILVLNKLVWSKEPNESHQ